MHHIYTTPAFVIHSSSHGEAGKFLLLFTKDFGMIGAVAQGIRLSQSKLRYHVQDGDFSLVSIVRGKDVWRLTGAHELSHEKNTFAHLKIVKFLRRLLQGEEKNEKLFEIVEHLYQTHVEEKDFDSAEGLTMLRILNSLGYIQITKDIAVLLENDAIDSEAISYFIKNKRLTINIINGALKESQL